MSDNPNAVADRACPGLRAAILRILNGWAKVGTDAIEPLVSGGYDAAAIAKLVPFAREDNVGALRAVLDRLMLRSMNAEAKRIGSMRFADAFTTINAETIAFLERYALALVTDLEADVRANVKAILIRGAQEGWPVRLQAKAIAEAIGLNARQELALWNVQRTVYQDAIAAGKNIIQAETAAAKAMEKARARMVKYRATTIARTEVIRSQNAGQQAVWDQYQREGLLPMNATKVWIVTPDDRLCIKICKPMDGVEVALDGEFDTPAGRVPYPPAHASCRCTQSVGRA